MYKNFLKGNLESRERVICSHFALIGFKCDRKKLCLLESLKLLLLW